LVGRSTVVGAWATAGTPCAGQTSVILRSGEVESERGRTVGALAGFIGAGAGRGMGLAQRGAVRAGLSVGACSSAPNASTRGRLFLPVF
jgi:hypothetical protein